MGSWVKITLPLPPDDSLFDAQLVAMAQLRDKELGSPPGFAVFDHFDARDNEQFVTLYFSPVAASACVGMLDPFSPIPCERPDAALEGLGLTYGDMVGTSSWDLLK